mmetsp:Transcript_6420/g.22897  ORF Transcript_6420/g.22897 Transcript_6420/m.22897 type:complete len:360 (-) Transcript_6420:412-1491(-)
MTHVCPVTGDVNTTSLALRSTSSAGSKSMAAARSAAATSSSPSPSTLAPSSSPLPSPPSPPPFPSPSPAPAASRGASRPAARARASSARSLVVKPAWRFSGTTTSSRRASASCTAGRSGRSTTPMAARPSSAMWLPVSATYCSTGLAAIAAASSLAPSDSTRLSRRSRRVSVRFSCRDSASAPAASASAALSLRRRSMSTLLRCSAKPMAHTAAESRRLWLRSSTVSERLPRSAAATAMPPVALSSKLVRLFCERLSDTSAEWRFECGAMARAMMPAPSDRSMLRERSRYLMQRLLLSIRAMPALPWCWIWLRARLSAVSTVFLLSAEQIAPTPPNSQPRSVSLFEERSSAVSDCVAGE